MRSGLVTAVLSLATLLAEPVGATGYQMTFTGILGHGAALTAAGRVAGSGATSLAGGSLHAFLFEEGVLTDLGVLGIPPSHPSSASASAFAAHDLGGVVGVSTTADETSHAFVYRGGAMVDLGVPPGAVSSWAVGVNAAGHVIGNAYMANAITMKAFLYDAGTLTDLGALDSSSIYGTKAEAINDAGQVTGQSAARAFLYDAGTMIDVGTLGGSSSIGTAITPGGRIVGGADLAPFGTHAFLYDGGVMVDLGTLGGEHSMALAANDQGDVVGWAETPTHRNQAFLYRGGIMTNLGPLDGSGSSALAINASGQAVGTMYDQGRAFVIDGGVMQDLNTLVLPGGPRLTSAIAINDAGQILCDGDGGVYLLTPIGDTSTTSSTIVGSTTTSTGTIASTSSSTTVISMATTTSTTLVCADAVPATTQKLTTTRLLPPAGDERLVMKGEAVIALTPSLDPAARGARLLLVGATDVVLLDVSIPAGAYDRDARAGWKTNGTNTAWTYKGPGTTTQGIRDVTMKLDRRNPGTIKFRVKGSNGTYSVAATDVAPHAILVVDGAAGRCIELSFPATPPASPSCTVIGGATLRCR